MQDATRHETMTSSACIGIDVGDRYSHFCVLDDDAKIVEEGRFQTTQPGVKQCFARREPARVFLEVGGHSRWMQRQLSQLGHEVVVANARQLALIHSGRNKHDRIDAEKLARLGRADVALLHPIRHRSEQVQQTLTIARSRDVLVRARTAVINAVRGQVKTTGARLPSCSSAAFAGKARDELPAHLEAALLPLIETVAELTARIKAYDKQLERLGREHEEVLRLMQVPGVGPLTALTFVSTLEDPARFRSGRVVGAYLGLCPRQRQSGERNPQLRITKEGDAFLRRLLVQSAHYLLGPFAPDCDLRRWGLRIAARGGPRAKKQAAVAVARKLAVLLHRLWVSGDDYEPQRRSPGLLKTVPVRAAS